MYFTTLQVVDLNGVCTKVVYAIFVRFWSSLGSELECTFKWLELTYPYMINYFKAIQCIFFQKNMSLRIFII